MKQAKQDIFEKTAFVVAYELEFGEISPLSAWARNRRAIILTKESKNSK